MRTLHQLMDLSHRTALVTGGAGHIGASIAVCLAELGAKVAIVDRDAAACAAQASTVGGGAWGRACDLADEKQTRDTVRGVLDRFGGLDIFIHCAAYVGTTAASGWAVPFQEQSVAAWDCAIRINLTAPFIIAQEAHAALRVAGRGSIVLIGSIYGLVGPDMRLYDDTAMANPAGYGVSKGGLLQLTRYLATVFAPSVRVNAITPGGVFREQPEVFQQRYIERTPLRRMAKEEDFRGAAAFLASDLSAYMTGHNLVVDGGWTAW